MRDVHRIEFYFSLLSFVFALFFFVVDTKYSLCRYFLTMGVDYSGLAMKVHVRGGVGWSDILAT